MSVANGLARSVLGNCVIRLASALGCAMVALLALAGAIAMMGPGLIWCSVISVMLGTLAWMVVSQEVTALHDAGPALRCSVAIAASVESCCLVVGGAVALIGPGGFALLIPLVIAEMFTLRHWCRRALRTNVPPDLRRFVIGPRARPVTESARPTQPGSRGVDLAPPRQLSTQQLCSAWRRSYVLLLDESEGSARQVIVSARSGYLDELETRNSEAFARWLAAGARAASNPARYFLA